MFLKHRQIVRKQLLVMVATASCLGTAFPAMAFVVSGKVEDSANNGIPRIQVKVFEAKAGPDTLVGTTYANDTGNYSVDVGALPGMPDIYVKVEEWAFQMLPAAALNNHLIKLTEKVDSSCAPQPCADVITPYTAKTGATVANHNPANPLPAQNLTMNEAQPARLVGLIDSLNLSMNYYEDNKGTITWDMTYDIPVRVRIGNVGSYHSVGTITISQDDFPPAAAGGFASDIYHETGHLVHYRIGDNLPAGGCGGPHWEVVETNTACAIKEGWASYIGELTDASAGGANDDKYEDYADPMSTHWRGNESPDATGRDGGTYESGEIVEGAYGGIWFAIDDVAGTTEFTDNFRVMVDDDPDDMSEFIKAIVTDNAGSAANRQGIYASMQMHGIVYNRPRFEVTPFDEMEPPDTAPATPENYAKEIGGVMFLSGTEVTVKLEDTPKETLGVAQIITTDTVKIGYKTATDGDTDEGSTITTFTPEVNFQVAPKTLDLDTAAIGDGDWDLVVIGKNTDGFTDNLLPSWKGDGTTAVDSDEKYLKSIGTWYDKDRNPATPAADKDKEGKVAIDNTAPTIDAAEFKPQ